MASDLNDFNICREQSVAINTTTHEPAVVLLSLERFFAVTHSEQVPLVNIESHDLLEQLVERLETVGGKTSEMQLTKHNS